MGDTRSTRKRGSLWLQNHRHSSWRHMESRFSYGLGITNGIVIRYTVLYSSVVQRARGSPTAWERPSRGNVPRCPPGRVPEGPPEAWWAQLTAKSETVPKLPIEIQPRGGMYMDARPCTFPLSVGSL